MTPDELKDDVVRKYSEHINPYLAKLMNFAGFGVEVRAEGCRMYDEEGNAYLDFLGGYGVFSLGHRHPKVVEAVKAQLDVMPLSGKTFFSQNQANLAEKLTGLASEGIEFAFFSNSGAEAVEAALKFARCVTGRQEVVATFGGYHGKTAGAVAVTGRDKYRLPFGEMVPGAVFVDYGDAGAMRAVVSEKTAAVIVEALQGEGGIHVPPAGYLAEIRAICDLVGAKLIVDEVQTGLGRTGTMLGCEHDGVSPDIITLAKALGGGVMPIGATLFTQEIVEAVFSRNPLAHTSTFGGNPVACAAGLAALEVIESEGLCEASRVKGERLMAGLRKVQEGSELLAEVRGKGLMVGVEFAMDEVGELAIAQVVKRGLVAAYTLNNPRVIRFEPPLVIPEADIDEAVRIFGEAVEETEQVLQAFA